MVLFMTHEDLEKEKMYLTNMHVFRSMLKNGILTLEEYRRAEQLMAEKYKPKIGILLEEIALT